MNSLPERPPNVTDENWILFLQNQLIDVDSPEVLATLKDPIHTRVIDILMLASAPSPSEQKVVEPCNRNTDLRIVGKQQFLPQGILDDLAKIERLEKKARGSARRSWSLFTPLIPTLITWGIIFLIILIIAIATAINSGSTQRQRAHAEMQQLQGRVEMDRRVIEGERALVAKRYMDYLQGR